MVVKSVNLLANDYCNSKCIMCKMGENVPRNYYSPEQISSFFRNAPFNHVEEFSISGGEPFMREDLKELTLGILPHLPSLESFFINTNGTYKSKVVDYCRNLSPNVKNLFLSVSIEGSEEVHNKVRGIRGFSLALDTLESILSLDLKNLRGLISTTLTKENIDTDNLYFIDSLSKELGCDYTFRIAEISETYYLNKGSGDFIPRSNLSDIVSFIDDKKREDPFLKILKDYILNGNVDLMGDNKTGIKCEAGETFIFIDARGDVRPCIYSSRVIGDLSGFVPKRIKGLGDLEPCPCCTECTIYPMLNYGGKN